MSIFWTDRFSLAAVNVQQSDDTFDLPSALNEIERSTNYILDALIHSFVLGASLLELNAAFRGKPTPEQVRVHDRFLTALIKVAGFIGRSTRHFPPSDLAGFVLARD